MQGNTHTKKCPPIKAKTISSGRRAGKCSSFKNVFPRIKLIQMSKHRLVSALNQAASKLASWLGISNKKKFFGANFKRSLLHIMLMFVYVCVMCWILTICVWTGIGLAVF